jgi:hypothetical protein
MENFTLNQILIAIGCLLVLGWLVPSPLSWFTYRKLQDENRALRDHLHLRMQIDAEGTRQLKLENDNLKQLNANLRVTNDTLRNKPGHAELRLLHIYDEAINLMLARAPGFAPTWQSVLEEVGNGMKETEQGLRGFVRKVFRPSERNRTLSVESTRLLNQQPPEQH